MNWKKSLKMGISGAATFAIIAGGGIIAEATAPQVQVTGGTIQGYTESGLKIFKGIPYADTTAVQNRWCAPQPVKAWRGVALKIVQSFLKLPFKMKLNLLLAGRMNMLTAA